MAAYVDDVLTTIETRLYFSLDDAVTIDGDVATVPVGFTELDDNSKFNGRFRATTGDGQRRKDRGHAHPVHVNSESSYTFDIKITPDIDPAIDLEIKQGTILRFLLVKGDGYYVSVLVIVTEVNETSDVAGLQGWEGTAEGREHEMRGKITTWPPA